jgi:excisionase family DNA binding protein
MEPLEPIQRGSNGQRQKSPRTTSESLVTAPKNERGEDLGPLLTAAEAAIYLATSERHIRHLWQERRISAVKVGRRVRYLKSDLDAYINSHRRDFPYRGW